VALARGDRGPPARWQARDPLAKPGPGSQGWNRYAYVGNNPATYTDPSGLCQDPGGPGIRYCLARWVPYPSAYGPVGRVHLDDRGTSPHGGSTRIQHLVGGGSGTGKGTVSPTTIDYYGGGTEVVEANDQGCLHKSRVLGPEEGGGREIRFLCRASTNAFEGAGGPIVHDVTVWEDTAGNATVIQARGTPFPSLELYQYGGPHGTDKPLFELDVRRHDGGLGPYVGPARLGVEADLLPWGTR
jgi:hypothetical protein